MNELSDGQQAGMLKAALVTLLYNMPVGFRASYDDHTVNIVRAANTACDYYKHLHMKICELSAVLGQDYATHDDAVINKAIDKLKQTDEKVCQP